MRPAALALHLALLTGALGGCVHDPSKEGAKEGVRVEAEGWSPLDARKPLETKQRALAEAQKKAVEKVMGVTVSATTKVEAAITLEQKILANIGGYIRRYEILSEREEDGFLKTRIRAWVLRQPPKPLPAAIRIAVLCADERLARSVRAALTSQGFTLADAAADADYTVGGKASAYSLTGSNIAGLRTGRARVSLDMTQAKTLAAFQTIQEASGLDPIDELARDKAVDIAARMAGEALASHLKAALDIPDDVSVSGKP